MAVQPQEVLLQVHSAHRAVAIDVQVVEVVQHQVLMFLYHLAVEEVVVAVAQHRVMLFRAHYVLREEAIDA